MGKQKETLLAKEYIDFDVDIFNSDIDFTIDQFCIDNKVQDLKLESNNFFNALMIDIYNKCIKYKYNLWLDVSHNSNYSNFKTHKYNTDVLIQILNIYIALCYKYNKDININSFSLLTNIDYTSICGWGHLEPTSSRFYIWKTLNEGRQQCLTNKLADGNKNPVGVIAILNHFYNWQTTASAQGTANKNALTSEDLPQLADNNNVID